MHAQKYTMYNRGRSVAAAALTVKCHIDLIGHYHYISYIGLNDVVNKSDRFMCVVKLI